MRQLDALMADSDGQKDPIEEQLRQCPDAFKAGEIVGKLFDPLRYDDNTSGAGYFLPPAGALIPPLV